MILYEQIILLFSLHLRSVADNMVSLSDACNMDCEKVSTGTHCLPNRLSPTVDYFAKYENISTEKLELET